MWRCCGTWKILYCPAGTASHTFFPDCIFSELYFFKSMLWNHGSIKFPTNSLLIAMGVIALASSMNLLSTAVNFWNTPWQTLAANCQQTSGYSELVLVLKNHTHTYITSFLPLNTNPDFRHSCKIYFVSMNKYILCCICCEIAFVKVADWYWEQHSQEKWKHPLFMVQMVCLWAHKGIWQGLVL